MRYVIMLLRGLVLSVLMICCSYAVVPSAARSSVRSAIRSPLTAMDAAFHGEPEAAVGYTPAV